jgi:hypothetical protein
VVRDLVLQARTIRYRRERWITLDGRTVIAPLPSGLSRHFGPELRHFVLAPRRLAWCSSCKGSGSAFRRGGDAAVA